MSFLLLAAAAAVLAAGAGVLAARRQNARSEPEAAPALPPAPPQPADVPGLPLQVGDVVAVEVDDPSRGSIARVHRERWLEGGLVLYEGSELVGAIFVAPEGPATEAVAAFAAPRRDIGWLSPVDVDVAAEPPPTLEIGAVVMTRRRRLFVRVEREGKGAPRMAGGAMFAEYSAAGRAIAVVLRAEGMTAAFAGELYEAGEYEKWGKGS